MCSDNKLSNALCAVSCSQAGLSGPYTYAVPQPAPVGATMSVSCQAVPDGCTPGTRRPSAAAPPIPPCAPVSAASASGSSRTVLPACNLLIEHCEYKLQSYFAIV